MKHPFIVSLLALACLASSQTPGDYLRMRHEDGIKRPVKQDVLDTLIGSKICEVDGVVKGSFKISYGARMVQLERPTGDTLVIEADSLPTWLSEGDVRVRLIVRATREQVEAPLRLTLLASCTEDIVAADEEASTKKKVAAPKLRTGSTASRGGYSRQIYMPESRLTPYYASFIRKQNPKLSPQEADRIATAILGYSAKYGLKDPRLIVAIIVVESGFDPNSTSHSGAMGLGQLMPDTAKWMGVQDAYDDLSNIEGCIKLVMTHLRDYYRQTGDVAKAYELMLAAYNAGEGAVRRHGGVPPYPETIAYIRHVITEYNHLCGY